MIESIVTRVNERIERNQYFAVANTHDKMSTRIFKEQKDRNGNSSKPYSTKPIYVSADKLPRQAGERRGKTFYFQGGYSELKRAIGRPHLEYFGTLGKDFDTGLVEINKNLFQVILSEENKGKIERHFPEFFKFSKEEIEYLKEQIIGSN